MRKVRLSGAASKGIGTIFAALAVAACVVAAIEPWMTDRGGEARVWATWDGILERPVSELWSLATLPVLMLVVGFALLLLGLAGRPKHVRVAGFALLGAAPLYYLGVVAEAGRGAAIALGFWMALAAAALAFAAAHASPSKA